MPRTVDIPGGTATLRLPDEIRERDRRLITAASMAAAHVFAKVPAEMQAALQGAITQEQLQKVAEKFGLKLRMTADELILLNEIQDASIKAFLIGWTLEASMPNSVAEVPDMKRDVYDALAAETAEDAAKIAQSNFAPSPKPDDRPTGGSTPSSGPSKVETSKSTLKPAGITARSSGGGSSPA